MFGRGGGIEREKEIKKEGLKMFSPFPVSWLLQYRSRVRNLNFGIESNQ